MRRDEARITMFFLYNAKLHHLDLDFGNDTLDTSLYMCTQTKYFLI